MEVKLRPGSRIKHNMPGGWQYGASRTMGLLPYVSGMRQLEHPYQRMWQMRGWCWKIWRLVGPVS